MIVCSLTIKALLFRIQSKLNKYVLKETHPLATLLTGAFSIFNSKLYAILQVIINTVILMWRGVKSAAVNCCILLDDWYKNK